MSEETIKSEISNKETDSDASQSKAKTAFLRSDLNESSSPKVTPESFAEHAREKLKDTFFSGTYEDRVFLESIQGYRDRVIIDEEERRLIKSLKN